jgi:PhnB protein
MAKKKTPKRGGAKPTTRRSAPKRAAKPTRKSAAKRAAAPAAAAGAGKVTPYLCVKGGAAALDFYKKAFGAIELMRIAGKDGSIGHADIEIEGAQIFVSDEWPEGGVFSPQTLGGSPVSIHLYVRDVDDFAARALKAGASEVRAVADQPYGDRSGTLRDPFGHRWMVASKKEEVSKEEMERRFGGAYLVT